MTRFLACFAVCLATPAFALIHVCVLRAPGFMRAPTGSFGRREAERNQYKLTCQLKLASGSRVFAQLAALSMRACGVDGFSADPTSFYALSSFWHPVDKVFEKVALRTQAGEGVDVAITPV